MQTCSSLLQQRPKIDDGEGSNVAKSTDMLA